MCPEGFVLGPDWKNCDDVDECAAGDNHDNENRNHDNHNHDTHDNYNQESMIIIIIMILSPIMMSAPLVIVIS